jgi:DNA repair photolyase
MQITEKNARSILTRTNISGIDYCLNPYVGCAHACRYCYATFMSRFSGHTEPWGSFVDVKVNAVGLLRKALRRRHEGEVILSSVTDPYQPVEKTYRLTRECLELLAASRLSVSILTKSHLVERDLDILERMGNVEVGLTISTDSEKTRRIFEPGASSIAERLGALGSLHSRGIPTYVFVGPMLPMDPERLAERISPYAGKVLVDRMNYAWKVKGFYRRYGLDFALDDAYFEETESKLAERLGRLGVETRIV